MIAHSTTKRPWAGPLARKSTPRGMHRFRQLLHVCMLYPSPPRPLNSSLAGAIVRSIFWVIRSYSWVLLGQHHAIQYDLLYLCRMRYRRPYCGCGTTNNKIRWGVFALLMTVCIALSISWRLYITQTCRLCSTLSDYEEKGCHDPTADWRDQTYWALGGEEYARSLEDDGVSLSHCRRCVTVSLPREAFTCVE